MREDLSALPPCARVAIYGNGGRGRRLRTLLARQHPGVAVAFFIDSFRESARTRPATLTLDQFIARQGEADLVLVASTYQDDIVAALKTRYVNNYLIFDGQRLVRAVPPRVTITLENMAPLPGPPTYVGDIFATTANCDFLHDPGFVAAVRRGADPGDGLGHHYSFWRTHVALWAARHAATLPGDFVECGVFKGFTARAVAAYVGFEKFPGRRFFLLDTFEGIPEEQISATERAMNTPVNQPIYRSRDTEAHVRALFADVPGAVIVRGRIPETLARVDADKVAFLHLDMNVAEPEAAALEFFWDRLVPGGVVILDDYGFSGHNRGHIVQKRTLDAVAARFGVGILSLPTGQGVILKPGS